MWEDLSQPYAVTPWHAMTVKGLGVTVFDHVSLNLP